jgi:hypothetical protein
MKKTLAVINEMVKQGVIKKYAVGGAIGAMFYTESFNTKDLDIFIYPQILSSGLVHLDHIYKYLKSKGYSMWRQYFMIEGVPVDFIPVSDKLIEEALENSVVRLYGKIKVKVLRPEYLIAIALKTARPQDLRKSDMLLQQAQINRKYLADILKRHKIKWQK